jgi:hypothetical protein
MAHHSAGGGKVAVGAGEVKVGGGVLTATQLFGPQTQGCWSAVTVLDIHPPSTGVNDRLI